jgi:uroporphyrinogen-III synthase
MRVLVTRPMEDAERTADALRAAGHEPVVAPIFAIRPLPHRIPAGVEAFAATSANALRQARFEAGHLAISVFAVGDATAAAARQLGFTDVRSADGDAGDLARLLAGTLPAGASVGYLAGKQRRDEALQRLEGVTIVIVETYENAALGALPDAIRGALESSRVDAVLHFSARSIEIFAKLVASAGLTAQAQHIRHVFISEAAVWPGFARRTVAVRPTLAAMIAALDSP